MGGRWPDHTDSHEPHLLRTLRRGVGKLQKTAFEFAFRCWREGDRDGASGRCGNRARASIRIEREAGAGHAHERCRQLDAALIDESDCLRTATNPGGHFAEVNLPWRQSNRELAFGGRGTRLSARKTAEHAQGGADRDHDAGSSARQNHTSDVSQLAVDEK